MTVFTLDTSGQVPTHGLSGALALCWGSLDAFTQGYIEALFASVYGRPQRDETFAAMGWGFSDLAPETLARIIADCERFHSHGYATAEDDALDGRMFWGTRNAGEWSDVGFPPLTPHLGDDGLIYLREAS